MIDLNPACGRMIDVLAGIADDQLAGPTPCAEYTVGDLVDHVDTASRVFAAVARKDRDEPSGSGAKPAAVNLGVRWRDTVADHLQALAEAWDDPAAWQGTGRAAGLELSNQLWGKIALTEVVVHGWDLARATGQPFDLPETTLRACLDHVVEFVPNAPVEGLWGPAVEVPTSAPLLDQVVAITGRRP